MWQCCLFLITKKTPKTKTTNKINQLATTSHVVLPYFPEKKSQNPSCPVTNQLNLRLTETEFFFLFFLHL